MATQQAPTYSGILHKKGEKGIKTYKKRWCILLNNEILYFKDERDYRSQKEPLGKILLVAATVTDLRSQPNSNNNSGVLADESTNSTGSSGGGGSSIRKDGGTHSHFKIDVPGRTYALFTETSSAVDGWVKAIKASKEFHNPVNQQQGSSNNTLTNSQASAFTSGNNSMNSNQTQTALSSNVSSMTLLDQHEMTNNNTSAGNLKETSTFNAFNSGDLSDSITAINTETLPPAPSSGRGGIALPGMTGIPHNTDPSSTISPRAISPRVDPSDQQRKVASPLKARPKAPLPSPPPETSPTTTSTPMEKPGRPPRPAFNTLGKQTPNPVVTQPTNLSVSPSSNSPAFTSTSTTPLHSPSDSSSLQNEIQHLKKLYGSRISSLEAQLKGLQEELKQKDQSFRRLEEAFLNLVHHVGAPDSLYSRPTIAPPSSSSSSSASSSSSSSSSSPSSTSSSASSSSSTVDSYPIAGENRPRSSSLSDVKFRNTMAPTPTKEKKARNETFTIRPSRTAHLPALNNTNSASSSSNSQLLSQDLRDDINRFQLEGYAKAYFQGCNRKFQFRRKKVELKALLSHSRDEFSAPLLKLNAALSTQAVLVFRLILTYMGDVGSQVESSQLIQQVIEKAMQFPELRDEIYCQLCKQTCNNPSKESYYRGWDVLVVCVNHFVPTKNLEPWLLSYLAAHLSIPGKDSKYAHYCIEKIQRVGDRFIGTRVPTIQEIEREKEYPFGPSIFGCSLENAMELQRQTHPQLTVPVVIYCLLDTIVKQNGFSTEGIFRIAADGADLYKLRHQIDCGNYDLTSSSPSLDPHIPANLLKLWLRDLPTPLIPFDLYPLCIQRAASNDPRSILDLVDRIPSIAREVLLYIIGFIQSLATPQHQPATKMGFSNLAIIFAPSLLRPSEVTLEALQNSQTEILFVLKLFKLVDAKQRLFEKNGYLPPFLMVGGGPAGVDDHLDEVTSGIVSSSSGTMLEE